MTDGQFQRVAEHNRHSVRFRLDGSDVEALEGDTLLTAILLLGKRLRDGEFDADRPGGGPRAGFCLMGACQDCWIWRTDSQRIRACTTYVTDGLEVRTKAP